MSILIGHASISEKGTINGAKGDSTKKEVCTRTWYSKPWDFMAIHPDAAVREKHAKAIEAACANNNIGYGQGDRNTLNTLAKMVGYDLSKVGKCNCDCSSLQNVAAVASGASGATYGSNGWVTSNMKAKLIAAGYIIITDSKYLTSEAYCVRGAIYVKASSHTVCGLSNGSKANDTLVKAGINTTSKTRKTINEIAKEVVSGKWGNGTDRKNRLKAAGYDVTAVQNEVNRILKGDTTQTSKTVNEIAKEVIAGKWGNGTDRKNRLKAAGYDVTAVQNEVNRMLK